MTPEAEAFRAAVENSVAALDWRASAQQRGALAVVIARLFDERTSALRKAALNLQAEHDRLWEGNIEDTETIAALRSLLGVREEELRELQHEYDDAESSACEVIGDLREELRKAQEMLAAEGSPNNWKARALLAEGQVEAAIEARDFAEAKLREEAGKLEKHCETCPEIDRLRTEHEAHRVRLIEHNNELLERARQIEGWYCDEHRRQLRENDAEPCIECEREKENDGCGFRITEDAKRIAELEKALGEARENASLQKQRYQDADKALAEMTAMQADAAEKACRNETERDAAFAELGRMEAQLKVGEELAAAGHAALRYAERNECRHEVTVRQGAIWTHCEGCGLNWADDSGGFVPYEEPREIADLRSALSAWDAGKVEESRPCAGTVQCVDLACTMPHSPHRTIPACPVVDTSEPDLPKCGKPLPCVDHPSHGPHVVRVPSSLEDVLARVKQLDEQAPRSPWRKGEFLEQDVVSPGFVVYGPDFEVCIVSGPAGNSQRECEYEADYRDGGVTFIVEARTLLPRLARALEIAVGALQRHYDDGCTPLGPDLAAIEKALAPESEQA